MGKIVIVMKRPRVRIWFFSSVRRTRNFARELSWWKTSCLLQNKTFVFEVFSFRSYFNIEKKRKEEEKKSHFSPSLSLFLGNFVYIFVFVSQQEWNSGGGKDVLSERQE